MSGDDGTVQFRIGGTTFEVLEQTIRAKPDTLLCTLLDDPGRADKSEHIFVEGDPTLARHIIAWYRYGKIHIPASIGVAEMKRECCFFQLPDDVIIERESTASTVLDAAQLLRAARKRANENFEDAKLKAVAANIFMQLVNDEKLHETGSASFVAHSGTQPNRLSMDYMRTENAKIAGFASEVAQEFGWIVEGSTQHNTFSLKKGASSSCS